jgi:hypothetical protein
MFRINPRRLLFAGILIAALLFASAFVAFRPAQAADPVCDIDGAHLTGTASEASLITLFADFGETFNGGDSSITIFAGSAQGHDVFITIDVGGQVVPGLFLVTIRYSVEGCEFVPPPAPAIFLSDVCEPNAGFSSDGWMTLDSDGSGPLLVGASENGPWVPVAVDGPAWVLSRAVVEQAAASVGAASYQNMWVKAGEGGKAANLGSLIIGRDARMAALCGG